MASLVNVPFYKPTFSRTGLYQLVSRGAVNQSDTLQKKMSQDEASGGAESH